MDEATYQLRVRAVQLCRRELALAAYHADHAYGTPSFAHIMWHNFQPFLRDGSVEVWAADLDGIRPLMAASPDPRWRKLAVYTRLLVNELRRVDPMPMYGCGRCY